MVGVLKKDLDLYGKDNFKKEILCHCTHIEELNEKERHWIKHYKDLKFDMYNIKPGAGGGDNITNHPNRVEICRKISERRSNQKASIETRKLMSIAKKGKPANFNKTKVRCIHCNIESNAGNIERFHNDHCLKNPSIDLEKERLCRAAWNKGKSNYLTDSQRAYLRTKSAIRVANRPLITCPHCNYQSKNKGNMIKLHFDKCKVLK